MALDTIIRLLVYLLGPTIIVSILALFIHCVLTAHRNSERRYFGLDSILSAYPSQLRLLAPTEELPV